MERVELANGDMRVALLSYGAVTQGWWLGETPLVLGYADPEAYLTDPNFLGATVGRMANRVGGARFTLDGVAYELDTNEGANQLHGGPEGLWSRHWRIEAASDTQARLVYHSPEGEGGYPGAVEFELRVVLDKDALTYSFYARPDRPTPISMANHNYYCLGDPKGARRLQVAAAETLALGPGMIPTGARTPVAGGPLDFRAPAPLAQASGGVDHFFVFDPARDEAAPIATLYGADLAMRVFSDQPGAQVYTGHGLAAPFAGGDGTCIEPSGFPDAVNQPEFPSVIATPDRPYTQELRLEIGREAT